MRRDHLANHFDSWRRARTAPGVIGAARRTTATFFDRAIREATSTPSTRPQFSLSLSPNVLLSWKARAPRIGRLTRYRSSQTAEIVCTSSKTSAGRSKAVFELMSTSEPIVTRRESPACCARDRAGARRCVCPSRSVPRPGRRAADQSVWSTHSSTHRRAAAPPDVLLAATFFARSRRPVAPRTTHGRLEHALEVL